MAGGESHVLDVDHVPRADDVAAVQAEVAAQEQALIEARANKESIHLQLLRLLNPVGPGFWQRGIEEEIVIEHVDSRLSHGLYEH